MFGTICGWWLRLRVLVVFEWDWDVKFFHPFCHPFLKTYSFCFCVHIHLIWLIFLFFFFFSFCYPFYIFFILKHYFLNVKNVFCLKLNFGYTFFLFSTLFYFKTSLFKYKKRFMFLYLCKKYKYIAKFYI